MERLVTFSLDPAAASPEVLPYPERIKSLTWLRRLSTGADAGTKYDYLTKIAPQDLAHLRLGVPRGYWIDGDDFLRLDAIVQETTNCEMSYIQYTNYAGLAADGTFYLLEHADDLLEAMAIKRMGGITRNRELAAEFAEQIPDMLHTLVNADAERRETNTQTEFGFGRDYFAEDNETGNGADTA